MTLLAFLLGYGFCLALIWRVCVMTARADRGSK